MNIMLKLLNIKRDNGIISAEYDPENSGMCGGVSIDVESGKVIESRISKRDGQLKMYLNHAVGALKKLRDKDELPNEKIVMWY